MFERRDRYGGLAEYIEPYIRRIDAGKVKKRKRSGQYYKFLKLKQMVEGATNIVLIIAAVISIVKVIIDCRDGE